MRRRTLLPWGLSLLSPAPRAGPALRIGSWTRAQDLGVVASKALLAKAYAELGQAIEFIDLPVRRALQGLLSGELDGNLYRLAPIAQEHPELYRVPTAIDLMAVRAYAADPGLKLRTWSDLQVVTVAYERGVLAIERHLPPHTRKVEVAMPQELPRMLELGMVQVALDIESIDSPPGPQRLASRFPGKGQRLDEFPLYHLLLGKHRAIGERLDAVLARWQASGELARIRRQAIEQGMP